MKNRINNLKSHLRFDVIQVLIIASLFLMACEDFVEIDPPKNQLTGVVVFEEASTVEASFAHIYSELRENAFTKGSASGISYLLGHYTDELDLYSTSLSGVEQFYNNNVLPSNSDIEFLWDRGYNLIYATNRILEGVQQSNGLSEADKDRFLGESYFLRAFIHFHLVNLFGPIPYIDSSDYRINSEVAKQEEGEIYPILIADLLLAKSLLPLEKVMDNVRPNHWVASALLARVYLYHEDWDLSEREVSYVISQGGYSLTTDLEQVFKKDSEETLWQLDAQAQGMNTKEASTYIFISGPPPNSALTDQFVTSFEPSDGRFTTWVGAVSEQSETWYHPNKYKVIQTTGVTEECSILFRLSEMYLIKAEALAHLGNTVEALNFVNAIRSRATLPPIFPSDMDTLLDAIFNERRMEFFSEQGHRFFDLKRSGRASEVLNPIKPNWKESSVRLPLPETELIVNPNLLPQNEGY